MGTARRRHEFQADFGRRVRDRRKRLGLTQEQLAERIGRHYTYVSQLERGVGNPTMENLIRLAAALEMDPAALVRGLAVED